MEKGKKITYDTAHKFLMRISDKLGDVVPQTLLQFPSKLRAWIFQSF